MGEKALLAAVQTPFALSANVDKVSKAAWHNKPSWFVISENDRIIYPELQRNMAKKIGANATEISASHLSILARPQDVAAVIFDAAGVS